MFIIEYNTLMSIFSRVTGEYAYHKLGLVKDNTLHQGPRNGQTHNHTTNTQNTHNANMQWISSTVAATATAV